MVGKVYERYTKKLSRKDLRESEEINVKEISGKATFIRRGYKSWTMRIDGEDMRFDADEAAKKVMKHLSKKDFVKVKYFDKKYTSYIISFENQKQDVLVVNKKYEQIAQYWRKIQLKKQYKEKKEQEFKMKTYNLLDQILGSGNFTMILSKKCEGNVYNLVDFCVFSADLKASVRKMLDRNSIFKNLDFKLTEYNLFIKKYSVLKFDDYKINFFVHTSFKNRDCRCGADAAGNRSLIYGDTYCEYCIFKELNIDIPEKIYKNYNPCEHVFS